MQCDSDPQAPGKSVYDWILVFSVAEDPNLQIIRGQDPGDTAEELIHSDMRIDPVFLFHGTACLCIAVHAERQRRYKQINLAAVPRDLIIKGQRGPGPIDHQLSPGLCWICMVSLFFEHNPDITCSIGSSRMAVFRHPGRYQHTPAITALMLRRFSIIPYEYKENPA